MNKCDIRAFASDFLLVLIWYVHLWKHMSIHQFILSSLFFADRKCPNVNIHVIHQITAIEQKWGNHFAPHFSRIVDSISSSFVLYALSMLWQYTKTLFTFWKNVLEQKWDIEIEAFFWDFQFWGCCTLSLISLSTNMVLKPFLLEDLSKMVPLIMIKHLRVLIKFHILVMDTFFFCWVYILK